MDVRVNVSARCRARADAQSRSEGRGSAAIGIETPVPAGFCFAVSLWWTLRSRGFGLNARDHRAVFARRSAWNVSRIDRWCVSGRCCRQSNQAGRRILQCLSLPDEGRGSAVVDRGVASTLAAAIEGATIFCCGWHSVKLRYRSRKRTASVPSSRCSTRTVPPRSSDLKDL